MANIKLKKGDKVVVIAGKDTGKEGINMISKHTKPSPANQQGGIIRKENYIDISNVMYVLNGKPTRIGYKLTTETKDGKEVVVKQRIAKSTGEVID